MGNKIDTCYQRVVWDGETTVALPLNYVHSQHLSFALSDSYNPS